MARTASTMAVVVAVLAALAIPPAGAETSLPLSPPLAFAPLAYNAGTEALSVATADFTGDGRLDVAMMSGSYREVALDNKLYLYAQTGAGTLSPPVRYDTHAKGLTGFNGVTAGDIDADGDADAVLTSSKGVDLFVQQGGTLVTGDYYPMVDVRDAELADLNGDGHVDIAVTSGDGVMLLLGLGGGRFSTAVRITSTVLANKEFADLTGDGKADLVGYRTPNVYVFAGRGDGTVAPAVLYSRGGQYDSDVGGLALADFNGDGRVDVAVSVAHGTPRVVVLAQQEDGTLGAPLPVPTPDGAAALATADLNLDGRADLVVTLPGKAGILLQRPDGRLEAPQLVAIPADVSYGAASVDTGDVTGDGLPDVVMAATTTGVIVVRSARRAQTWGLGEHGQLGGGGLAPALLPTAPIALADPVAASAGAYHNLSVARDGTVWAWGLNNAGQLGDGTTTLRPSPVRINGLSGVISVAAGGVHSAAIRNDGTLWTWGWNAYGQLGLGTTASQSVPVRVPGLENVIAVAAGLAHTLAVTADGSVWAWGLGHVGQLGTGSTESSSVPVRVVDLPPAKAVAAGHFHSLALGRDSTLMAWGLNHVGQLGTGTPERVYETRPAAVSTGMGMWQPQAIAAGAYHSVAIASWSNVFTWGLNTEGELGDGTAVNRFTPVMVPDIYTARTIAAGWYHTLVVTHESRFLVWGWNYFGQLGTGTTANGLDPVEVPVTGAAIVSGGAGHTLAITARG